MLQGMVRQCPRHEAQARGSPGDPAEKRHSRLYAISPAPTTPCPRGAGAVLLLGLFQPGLHGKLAPRRKDSHHTHTAARAPDTHRSRPPCPSPPRTAVQRPGAPPASSRTCPPSPFCKSWCCRCPTAPGSSRPPQARRSHGPGREGAHPEGARAQTGQGGAGLSWSTA